MPSVESIVSAADMLVVWHLRVEALVVLLLGLPDAEDGLEALLASKQASTPQQIRHHNKACNTPQQIRHPNKAYNTAVNATLQPDATAASSEGWRRHAMQ